MLWISSPLGSYDETGTRRTKSFLEELKQDTSFAGSIVFMDSENPDEQLTTMIQQKHLQPKIRWVRGSKEWSVRGRIHGDRLIIHFLNMKLAGTDHPTLLDRGGNITGQKVMQRFTSIATTDVAELEIEFDKLPCKVWQRPILASPEFSTSREIELTETSEKVIHVKIPLKDIRLYAVLSE
jgi:hypothetical protein